MEKNVNETDKLYQSLFLNTPFVDDLILAFAKKCHEFFDGDRFNSDFVHRGSRHQKCRRFYDWLLHVYPKEKHSSDFNEKQETIWKFFHNSGNAAALEILQLIIAQQNDAGSEESQEEQEDPEDYVPERSRRSSRSNKRSRNIRWLGGLRSMTQDKSTGFVFSEACRAARVGDIDKLTDQINVCENDDIRPITETDWSSKTLLHNIVDQGLQHPNQIRCIDVLLDFAKKHRMKNDLLDAKDFLNEETALHLAIKRESVVLCRKLLSEGSDYLIRNHNGESCLELLYEKLPQIIEFLLDKSVATNGDTTGDLFDLSIDFGTVTGYKDRIVVLNDDNSLSAEKQKFSFDEECSVALQSRNHGSQNLSQRNKSRISEENFLLNVLPQTDGNSERIEEAKYPIVDKSLRKIVNRKRGQGMNYTGEMGMLANLVYTNPKCYPIILSHPVVKVFLDLKWKRMKNIFRISTFLHISFCALLMWVAYDTYLLKCPHSKKEPCEWSATDFSMITIVLISNTIFFVKELFEARRLAMIHSVTTYFQGKENCIQFIFIAFVYAVTIPVYYQSKFYRIQYGVAASGILLASIVIMLIIGHSNQSYIFHSAYVHVYVMILKRFLTVLITFSAVIIAFALSFSIIFGETILPFTTLDGSLGKMFMMLAGEFSFDEIFHSKDVAAEKSRDSLPVLAQILFIIFAAFITIVLIDVFLGYTISDIQDLKNRGEVIWRSVQVEQLYIMEEFFQSLKSTINFFTSNSKLLKLVDVRVVIPQRKATPLNTMQIELTSFSVFVPFKDINPLMRNEFRKIINNE